MGIVTAPTMRGLATDHSKPSIDEPKAAKPAKEASNEAVTKEKKAAAARKKRGTSPESKDRKQKLTQMSEE